MSISRYARSLVAGVVVLAIALVTAWAVGRGRSPAMDPVPAEELIQAAEVTRGEAEGVTWDLPVVTDDRVDFWIAFLKGRNYDKTRLWLERSGRYIPMIKQQLRARGMPEDLIYLALIESGFSTRAYSRAHAVGIWQFIEETGRRYGLRVTDYLDERRDPIKSTAAALDYLQELHARFGSWYLAAAAYNSGENRIERLLNERAGGKRGSDSLFWKIAPGLPQETRDYVPLMLAAGHIAKEPEKYGFKGLEYHKPLAYEDVMVPGGTMLRAVARAAEVAEDAIRELNPHLVKGVTPPGQNWTVRLPPGRRARFASNFERVAREERLATIEHEVRRGETLSHIAQRYGTSLGALEMANAGITPQRIYAGQRIRIPVGRGAAVTAVAATPRPPARVHWKVHRVRPGDSLWSISRRYGVSVDQLRAWNSLGRRSTIMVGQNLRIRS